MLVDVITFSATDFSDDTFAFQTCPVLVVESNGAAQALAEAITEAVGGIHTIERRNVSIGILSLPMSRLAFGQSLDQAIARRMAEYAGARDRKPGYYPDGFDLGTQIKRMQALRYHFDQTVLIADMERRAERLRAFLTGPSEAPVGALAPARLPEDVCPDLEEAWGVRDAAGRWMQKDGHTLTHRTADSVAALLTQPLAGRITFTDTPERQHPEIERTFLSEDSSAPYSEHCDDQNLADGPYDTRAEALEASVKALGLEVGTDDNEPTSTPTCG